MVEGITPPAMSVSASGTSPLEVSSVVAAGLEMGLGVNLASSALMHHVPGAGAAMAGLAEPRYLRTHQTGYETPLRAQVRTADSSQESSPPLSLDTQDSTSASDLPYRNGRILAQAAANGGADNQDSDLHRRRTTGTRDTKSRTVDPSQRVGRHHRADTHDPILANPRPTTKAELEKQQYYQNNYIAFRNETKITTHGLPLTHGHDAPLSATTSVDRSSSLGERSSTHAHASFGASFGGSTQPETPSIGDKAMLSPDPHILPPASPFGVLGSSALHHDGHLNGGQYQQSGWKQQSLQRGNAFAAAGHGPTQQALLGLGGGSHFGPGVRAKVSEVLPYLVSSVPLFGEEGETVTIAEYGSLNTRSINLMQPIISSFVDKAHADTPRRENGRGDTDDYFSGLDEAASLRSILGVDAGADWPCKVNFSVIHEDSSQADFRPLSQMLDTVSESYLNPQWQATHEPSLQNVIFPSFVARPFASRIAPPSTIHLGLSLMDLHWSHTPRNPAVSLSTSAHAELTAFLTARAHEFRKGGVFVMAYIARSEDSGVVLPDRPKSTVYASSPTEASASATTAVFDKLNIAYEAGNGSMPDSSDVSPARLPQLQKERTRSNSSPNRPSVPVHAAETSAAARHMDIWTTLTNTLAPCLQRLVSCGMLKSDVARHLLSLPMHARTPRQTRNVLKSVKHLWNVEWSCGLGDEPLTSEASDIIEGTTHLVSEPEPLRLPHPAWKALQAGTLSRVAFAEHMIQLFKNLYESHFRVILREKGKLSKGAVEFVLDSLWDVLQSRIDDQEPCPIAQCELEVQVVALRRL
ncbi:hypothetical protein BCV70DRAFT_209601 [Testicularia cyperi]|uniref:Uncharacterized protein n=1 Tax=Testicularia cyperi TaxID=1882483 RepID=A0A317Y0P3_9BASI|nr:hypothetical protein BCV70DRAFT_209601 [Testicularia cyperi]